MNSMPSATQAFISLSTSSAISAPVSAADFNTAIKWGAISAPFETIYK